MAQPSNDPARRLFSVDWKPSDATRIADGEAGRNAWAAALDRGAYACAAAQLGVGQQLIDMAVAYACTRKQFGVAIGTFQAIKHMLANAKVRVEYARALVYRAAYSVAHAVDSRAVDTSAAKVAAFRIRHRGREDRAAGARRARIHLGAGPARLDASRLVAGARLGPRRVASCARRRRGHRPKIPRQTFGYSAPGA